MPDEEILKLVEKHFSFLSEYTACGWIAETEDVLKFARARLREGYHQGVNDGQGHD